MCVFLWASVLVGFAVGLPAVQSIVRGGGHDTHPPSCNSYVVYDDKQVLVVDAGQVASDYDELEQALLPLSQGRTVRGLFLTHGHPDHATQAWRFVRSFGAPVFVASEDVRNDVVVGMRLSGPYGDVNDPGDPVGPGVKFNYSTLVVPRSTDELWMSSADEAVAIDVGWNSETENFGMLRFASGEQVLLFSGDYLYVGTHVYMGPGVELIDQCTWVSSLGRYCRRLDGLNVTVFPGHGAPSSTASLCAFAREQVADYVNFSRQVFGRSCNATAAAAAILARYPKLDSPEIVEFFNAPARVPADARALGCPCSAQVQHCPDLAIPLCS